MERAESARALGYTSTGKRVAVLHPGEMGSAVGAALVDHGCEVVWHPEGRSPATRQRAERAGLTPVDTLAGVDVVLSVCPPGRALEVARAVAGFGGVFVDSNAVSPATAQDVARVVGDGGATYVDGGIIGPPPTEAGTTRLYLSGDRASDVATLFQGGRLDARVLDTGPFAASAVKMAYASWTKVSAALLLSAAETADRLGVGDALREEWALSQPELAQRLDSARRAAHTKGWRWEAEMREIASTFGAAGEPTGFGSAAAEVFGRHPRPDQN